MRWLNIRMTFEEINSILFTTYLAIYLFVRGVFFYTATDYTIESSDWYTRLVEIVDVKTWGYTLIILALFMLISAFFRTKVSFGIFTAVNLIATLIYIVFSAAGVNHGINWFTPFMNVLNANFHLLLTVLGAWKYCQMKRR